MPTSTENMYPFLFHGKLGLEDCWLFRVKRRPSVDGNIVGVGVDGGWGTLLVQKASTLLAGGSLQTGAKPQEVVSRPGF